MKAIIICVLIAALTCAFSSPMHRVMMDLITSKPVETQFKLWHYIMQRPYDLSSQEGSLRFSNFRENVKRIKELNAKNLGFTVGLGIFSDEDFSADENIDFIPLITNESEDKKEKVIDFDLMADIEDENDFSQRLLKNDSPDWSFLYANDYPQIETIYNNNAPFFYDSNDAYQYVIAYTINGNAKIAEEFNGNASPQFYKNCSKNNNVRNNNTVPSVLNYLKFEKIPLEKNLPWNAKQGQCVDPPAKPYYELRWTSCNKYYGMKCTDNLLKGLIESGPYASSLYSNFASFHYTSGIVPTSECAKSASLGVIVTQITPEYVKALAPFGPKFGENGYIKVKNEIVGQPDVSCGLKSSAYLPNDIKFIK